ncbi:GNAT family N-acetyltransferase [Microcella sp.]|uniref:GNAT family N-acetyltransferase n=1 Tax=Microcella sp. TaxID=1913979 RepID=UPI003F7126EA
MDALIRPATATDAAALGAVHMACWREAYAQHLSAEFLARATPESSAARWATTLVSVTPDHRVLVADTGTEFVGFAMSGPARGEQAPRERELYAIYVRAAAHGTGIAQALLDDVIGDEPAFLWVLDLNPRATAFYRRNGFVDDGATMVLPEFEGNLERRMVR